MFARLFALSVLFLLCVPKVGLSLAAGTYRCPEGAAPLDSLVHFYSIGVRQPSVFTCIYGPQNGTSTGASPTQSPLVAEGERCGLSPIDEYAHGPDFGVHTCKGDRERCTVTCE